MLTRRNLLKTSAAAAASWSVYGIGHAAGEKITVSHSFDGVIYAAHFVAQARGFMAEQGLEMRIVTAKGGANVRRILAAGQVDQAIGDSIHPLLLTSKGKPARILMATDSRCSYANIAINRRLYDQGITDVAKLAEYKRPDGRKPVIAATKIGSGTWVYGTYVLDQLGVGDRFQWIGGGGAATMLGGLKTAKFDAIMAVPGWYLKAQAEGFGELIYDTSDANTWNQVFGGDIPASVIYVLEEAVTDPRKAEVTQRYVNGIYRSMQWIQSASVDQIHAEIGNKLSGGLSEALIKREIAYYKGIFQYDGNFTPAHFNNGGKVWFRKQTKIPQLNYNDVVDLSFLKKARNA